MTALAAGLALVPIALSAGEPGSEIQAPMAMVIMCGLLSSTALNMIVDPISTNDSVDRWRECRPRRCDGGSCGPFLHTARTPFEPAVQTL